MKVSQFSVKKSWNKVIYSAQFSFEKRSLNTKIWFAVPKEFGNEFMPQDAFFTVAYPLAATLHEDLEFEGSVSELLLDNVKDAVKAAGLKSYSVKVNVVEKVQRKKISNNTAQFFTLGMDSFYTLISQPKRKDNEKYYLLFVNGYDISFVSRLLMWKANKAIRETARYFGAEAIIMETNLRSLSERVADWGHYHGAALAAAAQLFPHLFSTVLYNSSTIHREKINWGTSETADYLWSTEATTCKSFGTDTLRPDKIKKVAQSEHFPFIKTVLRVCWNNKDKLFAPYNCSVCEKCLRTMLVLRAYGGTDLPTFKRFSVEPIQDFKIKVNDVYHWRGLSKFSEKHFGKTSPEYLAIQVLLARNHIS